MSQAHVSQVVGGLKLHETPNMKSDVIDTAAPGDKVELYTRLASGWAYVRYKNQLGYMWGSHLVDDPAQPRKRPPPPESPWWLDWPWGLVIAGAVCLLAFFVAVWWLL